MTACEAIRRITRPSILECISAEFGEFGKIKTLHAVHVVGAPMRGVSECINMPKSLRDLFENMNGSRIFLMNHEEVGALLKVPGWEKLLICHMIFMRKLM